METLTERRDDLFNLIRDDKKIEKDMKQNIEEADDIKSDFSSNEEEDIDDIEWGD